MAYARLSDRHACLHQACQHQKHGTSLSGTYKPFDLNMPLDMTKPAAGPDHLAQDTPITEIGAMTAQMIGRQLAKDKFFITHIYVPPAFRCVQTAHNVLKGKSDRDVDIV